MRKKGQGRRKEREGKGWEGKFRGREGKGVGKRGWEGKFRGPSPPPKRCFPRTAPGSLTIMHSL